jgi:hypothetical protein
VAEGGPAAAAITPVLTTMTPMMTDFKFDLDPVTTVTSHSPTLPPATLCARVPVCLFARLYCCSSVHYLLVYTRVVRFVCVCACHGVLLFFSVFGVAFLFVLFFVGPRARQRRQAGICIVACCALRISLGGHTHGLLLGAVPTAGGFVPPPSGLCPPPDDPPCWVASTPARCIFTSPGRGGCGQYMVCV